MEKVKYILLLLYSLVPNWKFWVYPKKYPGMGCLITHLNYYKLRNEMMVYMEKEGIKFKM